MGTELTPATMKRGGAYNWRYQDDRLIYLDYSDGKPYTLTWQGDDEKRIAPASAEFGLVRVPLGAQPTPQPAPLEDARS